MKHRKNDDLAWMFLASGLIVIGLAIAGAIFLVLEACS